MKRHGSTSPLLSDLADITSRPARAFAVSAILLLGTIVFTTLTVSTAQAATTAKGTLTFTPTSASFGDVGLMSSRYITVTIKNSGTARVTISAESVTGTEFGVSGPTAPKTLAPGGS